MKSNKIVNMKKDFSPESGTIHQDVTDFVGETLSQIGITKNLGAMSVLLSEETTVQFLRYAPEGSSLRVQVRRFLTGNSALSSLPFLSRPSGRKSSTMADRFPLL